MIQKMVNAQYRRPAGWLGRWIGLRMAQQHVPENEWTVGLLDVQPDDHILEIGFGPGIAIELLLPGLVGGKIAGIDYSHTMVEAARRRNREAVQSGQLDLRWGEAHQLPFDDAIFDHVFSIHSIYFWPEPRQSLQEIQRVLKPGGTLVLTILPAEDITGTPEFKPYSGSELRGLLVEAGFDDTRIERDALERSPSNFSLVARR